MNNEVYSIDFSGEISGKAKERFIKNIAKNSILPSCILALFISSILLFLYFSTEKSLYLWLMAVDVPLLIGAGQLPPPKSQIKKTIPRRVIIDGDMIVAIYEAGELIRYIEEASVLIDYGEYYVVKFPFGKLSEYHICQKDLLKSGTLEEFEALFEGKIERVKNQD